MIAVLLLIAMLLQAGPGKPVEPAAAPAAPMSIAEMRGKQAVMDTTMGTVVMQLLPESAPAHVAHFIATARAGGYDGTTFHRVVRYGIIQGGDPLSVDPARKDEYGTGGMNRVPDESRDERHTAGAVAAVLAPGQPNSAGAQFFICATDQPGLDGTYTVFARVVEGLEVVQSISAVDADPDGRPHDRIVIRSMTIRDTPPEPFANETDDELGAYTVVIETTMGSFELDMLPDKAPRTVRAFLRMVAAGVYDTVGVHRVSPNFVIQTGAMTHRATPLVSSQARLVGSLPAEFTDTPNVPGIVSMARGADPDSGSTSFFICTGECRSLDGQYTVFARVSRGMDVVAAIAAVPVDGETPLTPITITRARAERR